MTLKNADRRVEARRVRRSARRGAGVSASTRWASREPSGWGASAGAAVDAVGGKEGVELTGRRLAIGGVVWFLEGGYVEERAAARMRHRLPLGRPCSGRRAPHAVVAVGMNGRFALPLLGTAVGMQLPCVIRTVARRGAVLPDTRFGAVQRDITVGVAPSVGLDVRQLRDATGPEARVPVVGANSRPGARHLGGWYRVLEGVLLVGHRFFSRLGHWDGGSVQPLHTAKLLRWLVHLMRGTTTVRRRFRPATRQGRRPRSRPPNTGRSGRRGGH